jgi:mono/diheme cytochrome c family protein
MIRGICAAALLGLVAMGPGATASAAGLTEERVREIAAEVAERVAREVAEEIAAEIAAEVAAEAAAKYLEDNAGEDSELVFTPEFLADPAHIAAGKEIWMGQCTLCHGANSYPGKAPKLKPKRYTPNFVYDRVTNGFRKMPPWGEVYDEEERMDLVAWILSRKFSP